MTKEEMAEEIKQLRGYMTTLAAEDEKHHHHSNKKESKKASNAFYDRIIQTCSMDLPSTRVDDSGGRTKV